MADISPLIKLVGKVVKASGDAIVATMLENQTLTIQAAYAAKKTVTQWKEMVEECGSYLNEIGEPLEEYAEVVDLMMREEEGLRGASQETPSQTTLDNGYRTYGS